MKALLTTFGIVLCTAVVPLRCQSPPLLRFELEQKSKNLGLALLLDFGDEIGVYSFDRTPLFRKLPSGAARPTATPDGNRIIWSIQGVPYSSTIETESVAGGIVASEQVDCWLQIIATSSNHPAKIAFVSNLTELRYGASNSRISHVIEGIGTVSPVGGWSPDGTKLVFGREGKIRLLDTTKDRITVIDSGNDPTWSPNGQWISYRSSAYRAVLFDARSSQKRLILEDHILAPLPLRWSPDSEYVAYIERSARDASQWHLSVFRIRDNAITVVTPFSPISGYVTNWSWILKYQSFCRQCAPR